MTQSQFLQECIKAANLNLSQPDRKLPNGRMAHEFFREQLAINESALFDMQLDGLYHADGTFAEYTD